MVEGTPMSINLNGLNNSNMDSYNFMSMNFNEWLNILEQETFNSYLCVELEKLNINLSK